LKFCILLSIVNPIGVEKNEVKSKSLSCGFANFATDIGKKRGSATLNRTPLSIYFQSKACPATGRSPIRSDLIHLAQTWTN